MALGPLEWPRGRILFAIVIAAGGFTLSPAVLLAQPGETGVGEISGYTGLAFGGLGAHPAVGASSGLSLSRYVIALLDVSYIPLGSDALRSDQGSVRLRNSSLYDFTLCAHIRIPLRDKWEKWEPYGILGGAGLYSRYQIASIPTPGIAAVYKKHSTGNFGFETGMGVRYYVAENWGVRAEWNLIVSTGNFGRLVAGLFYQFEGQYPFRLRGAGNRGRLPRSF